MKIEQTFTNEFTGEVFTDKEKCLRSEKESKKYFVVELMAQMDSIKDICNNHALCSGCPFGAMGDCKVGVFADEYLCIVSRLRDIIK